MDVDWVLFSIDILKGVISGGISGVILLYVILPRIGARSATQTLKVAKKDPEIGPIIKKAQEILKMLEPLAKQFKNIDIEKIQKDVQPFIEIGKKIDPKAVEELLGSFKELADGFKTKFGKPENIPDVDP